jgi:hypothetical protein
MKFKKWFEMASFTLPDSIKIGDKKFGAIDMQFELHPKTLNRDGTVMNQGSKFLAKIPVSKNYIGYDGQGYAFFVSAGKIESLIKSGYTKIPDNWWHKARFLD